jgi:hypothetical protein
LNKHKSLSTKIIKERIEGFNKKAGKKEFSIEYRNLTNEATEVKGTRVTLILPIKESILEK